MFFNVMERYEKRIAQARNRLASVWRGENRGRPAVIISDVNYALCGQNDMPENYFRPEVMFEYQRGKIDRHMEHFRDDYVPVFHPWYGTAVLPSALGVKVRFQKGMDPAAEGAVLNCPEDIRRLKLPDPYRDGLMPEVLGCIDYFREHTDAPISVTDTQGPLNIALTLAGAQTLFVWMYEYPDAVHELMDFCTETLIGWVKAQKRHAGHRQDGDAYPHAIELPPGFGGVAFSDDDLVAISASHYREFVMPYNERLLAAFGGGTVHFCGSAPHQLGNLADMRGCTGVNNFAMGDINQFSALRERFRGRGGVMACDFNMEDIAGHCDRLADTFRDPAGVVAGVFIAPAMALHGGKYTESDRTWRQVTESYNTGLSRWLN